MGAEVVDASALAALLFGEPDADLVSDSIEGAELLAPSLIRYELASVCVKKLRAHPDQQEPLLAALDLYPRLGVAEADVPVVELARLSDGVEITAYDAAYLWLAREAGAPLFTLDTELARAATRLGVLLVS